MNLVFDLANSMMSHDAKNDFFAARLLDELGAEAVPVRRFNDDDWYTYDAETLELQAGRGAHYERPEQPKAPLKIVRGMTAKHLGLWQYKAEVAV